MRIISKLLVPILTIAIVLNNCGGIVVSAAENTVTAENAVHTKNSISENTPISDKVSKTNTEDKENDTSSHTESSQPNADVSVKTDETEAKRNLPALQIGQIAEGETLPSANDDTFVYDPTVSAEATEKLILFVNYDLEMTPEVKDSGTVEWSILRGKKDWLPEATPFLTRKMIGSALRL